MHRKLTLAIGLSLLGLAAPAHAQTPYCREYTRRVVIGGVSHEAYGTACQQPDGSWQIMNQAGDPPPPGAAAIIDPTYAPVPPPPVGADVTYIIHDDVPLYIDPGYIHYGPWHGYGYGYYPHYYGYGGYPHYHHFNE